MKKQTLLHLVRGYNADMETLMGDQQRIIVGTKGYGGGMELGQTIVGNMATELDQECSMIVNPADIELKMVIDFYNDTVDRTNPFGQPSVRMICGITRVFRGTPQESDEMKHPQWYSVQHPPIEKMILGDHVFFDLLFKPYTYYKGWQRKLVEEDEKGNKRFLKLLGSHFYPCTQNELTF